MLYFNKTTPLETAAIIDCYPKGAQCIDITLESAEYPKNAWSYFFLLGQYL